MNPDVVIVGGGPVGLWTAIQLKQRKPELSIQVYERQQAYQRSHVLRLESLSMLLYAQNGNGPDDKEFFKEVTGKTPPEMFAHAAIGGVTMIRTNDLEEALKTYAAKLGVGIDYRQIDDPQALMQEHPGCRIFIAADGAHSRMREALMGKDAVEDKPLQHVVEVKYQAEGKSSALKFMGARHKTNIKMQNMAFEYVGREKDGTTPVTLRFFVDPATYDVLPPATFKNPLTLDDPRIPPALAKDVQTYMDMRRDAAGESYKKGSAKISKLTLSVYAAKKFALTKEKKAWFLAGDAAMGVPYFRSLNAGMIIASQLAGIVTQPLLPLQAKVFAYNALRPLDMTWEFTAAHGKDAALKSYDMARRAAKPFKKSM